MTSYIDCLLNQTDTLRTHCDVTITTYHRDFIVFTANMLFLNTLVNEGLLSKRRAKQHAIILDIVDDNKLYHAIAKLFK